MMANHSENQAREGARLIMEALKEANEVVGQIK
jgi:hypothetical protein